MQAIMDKVDNEEKLTWTQQMKKAIMLHAEKDEDGFIQKVST